jgi:hypothetical protein
MKIGINTLLVTALSATISMTVPAQTVSIPIGQQAQELRGQPVPTRGMDRETVEARFGAPLQRSPPVGQPPISYWVYDDYTVYFEHNRVLHTVLKHR